MEQLINRFIEVWKSDYSFKTFSSSALSALICIAFTIYNGVIGLCYRSVWNGSICVYYCCLAVIRMLIVNSQRNERNRKEDRSEHRRKLHFGTHFVFFLINITLIVPIVYMVKGERPYNMGLIPAISMAAYTTYRIVMVIINTKKSVGNENILVKELRMLNIVDTVVAVLTLQNTMIMTVEGNVKGSMMVLSAISSMIIWLFIIVVSVVSFKSGRKVSNGN